MSYDKNNIFAKILRGEIPCKKVYENENVFKIKSALFMKNGKNKYLLRKIFNKYFSNEVAQREQKSPRPGSNDYLMFNKFNEKLNEMNKR